MFSSRLTNVANAHTLETIDALETNQSFVAVIILRHSSRYLFSMMVHRLNDSHANNIVDTLQTQIRNYFTDICTISIVINDSYNVPHKFTIPIDSAIVHYSPIRTMCCRSARIPQNMAIHTSDLKCIVVRSHCTVSVSLYTFHS